MRVFLPLALFLGFYSLSLQAQGNGGLIQLNAEGRFAAESNIRQSSGLAKEPDELAFWTHNDQGYPLTKIYLFNPASGQNAVSIIDSAVVNLPVNLDWEDMAKDNAGNLYIAQTGKNCNSNAPPDCPKRWIFAFHKLAMSALGGGNTVTPESYYFTYPLDGYPGGTCVDPTDTVFANVESTIWYNGAMYVFTKDIWSKPQNNCGKWAADNTILFRIPLTPGSSEINPITAEYVAAFDMRVSANDDSQKLLPLSAAINASQTTVALTTAGRLWIFYDFTGDNFFSGSQTWYTYTDNGTDPVSRAFEGMDFITETALQLSVDNVNGRVMSAELAGLPLPVRDIRTSAVHSGCDSWLQYSILDDAQVQEVALQISAEGREFYTVATQTLKAGKFIIDAAARQAWAVPPHFARLRITAADGSVTFSKVEHIHTDCDQLKFTLSANPASTESTEIYWDEQQVQGQLHFTLYDAQGKTVSRSVMPALTGSTAINMPERGLYYLHIRDAGGGVQVLKLIRT